MKQFAKTVLAHLGAALLAVSASAVLANTTIPGDDAQVVGALGAGQTITFEFDGDPGDWVLITLTEIEGSDFTPSIVLRNPQGTQLRSDDNPTTARVERTLGASGDHTIEVTDSAGNGGTFRLDFTRAPGANDGNAIEALQNSVPRDVGVLQGEVIAYQFVTSGTTQVVATAARNAGTSESGFRPVLRLFGPDAVEIECPEGEDSDSLCKKEDGTVARINQALITPGTYTLILNDAGYLDAGEVALELTLVPDADDGRPFVNGVAAEGSVAVGEVVAYRFDAVAGNHLVATLSRVSGSVAPRLSLLGPDGIEIQTDDDSPAFVDVALTQTGAHTLLVSDDEVRRSGVYSLDLSLMPGASDGIELSNEASVRQTLAQGGTLAPGETVAHQFVLASPGHVVATLTDTGADSFQPRLDLYGPDGARIDTDQDQETAYVNEELPSAGTYTLLIGEKGFNTAGTYRLNFTQLPGASGAGTVAAGDVLTGAVAPGEVLAFQFSADANTVLDIDLLDVDDTDTTLASFEPTLELYEPDGSLRFRSSRSTLAEIDGLTGSSGEHTLLLSSKNYDFAGNYRLEVQAQPSVDSGPLQNGVRTTIDIAVGEAQAFQLVASDGDAI
ncbi:MAG: hypothetical protein AAGL66_12365, partial [Pseudomonadota bacterium]